MSTVTADDLRWLAVAQRQDAEALIEHRSLREAMHRAIGTDGAARLLARRIRLARWLEDRAAEMEAALAAQTCPARADSGPLAPFQSRDGPTAGQTAQRPHGPFLRPHDDG